MRSQISSRGASMSVFCSTLMASAEYWERPLALQLVQRALHPPEHLVVDLVGVGLATELLPQVDRVEHSHADLRGQRPMAQHVADVQPPGDRDRDRQHLEPEDLVDPEKPR